MEVKNTLSISEARKSLFSIAENVQDGSHYVFTERGRPKVAILSAKRFEGLIEECEESSQKTINLQLRKILEQMEAMTAGRIQFSSFKKEPLPRNGFIIRDAARLAYETQQTWEKQINTEELIKAQLYVELIEKYRYVARHIELGRYVRMGGENSKRYIEADIIVSDEKGNVTLLFSVEALNLYEKEKERAIHELFDLADALSRSRQHTFYLIYFTRSHSESGPQRQATVINHQLYKTFSAWEKAGRPTEKDIPSHEYSY